MAQCARMSSDQKSVAGASRARVDALLPTHNSSDV
jgi:hypothetical protein